MVIGLIKMFGDGSTIRKVAIVENGAAMLPKALMEIRGDGAWSPQCTVSVSYTHLTLPTKRIV